MDLHRLIGAGGGDLGRVELRHRRPGGGAPAGVDCRSRTPGHQPGQLDLCPHVRQLELRRLERRDRNAELASSRRIRQRCVEACLGDTDGKRGDGHATTFEYLQELVQTPAHLADNVAQRHPAVVEHQFASVGCVPAELAVLGRLRVTGRALLNGDRRDLFVPVVPSGDSRDGDARADVGPGIGDERLTTVDHPLVTVAHRLGQCPRRVGSGIRLGESECPDTLARHQWPEPAFPLLGRAELNDRRDAERHGRLERDRTTRVGASDLLHGEAVGDEVTACATDLLREGQSKQPEPRHAGDEFVGEIAGLVVMGGPRRDLRLGEVAYHVANVTLLVTEIKVQCFSR